MADNWSEPTAAGWSPDEEPPYVHWWLNRENGQRMADAGFKTPRVRVFPPETGAAHYIKFPALAHTLNPDLVPDGASWDTLPDPEDTKANFAPSEIGELPENTVLVGVIDVGIPLGHRRTRLADGETRVLASWQQASAWRDQEKLPFGRELYAKDINYLLLDHSAEHDLANGVLDEEMFNRDAGLVEYDHRLSPRDLEFRTSHGAHVLDLAAGYKATDPAQAGPADNIRILSVNLPPQSMHGTAGNFITYYAGLAVERMFCMADAVWQAQNPGVEGGYPLVVNFSFGRQAGSKDGNSPWERRMRHLLQSRRAHAPTQIVMPVGNRNLARGNARAMLGQGSYTPPAPDSDPIALCDEIEVPWFIPPTDQTSNFVEFWAKAQPVTVDEDVDEAGPADFTLSVSPPDQMDVPVPALHPGQYSDLGDYARIYCHQAPAQDRPSFVICVGPTEQPDGGAEAPAGHWQIKVAYTGAAAQEASLSVQTDQSARRDIDSGLQSFFDHPNYKIRDEAGRLIDSYSGHTDNEPWDDHGPVQRKGTQNELASWQEVVVIGSFRVSDGKPALYSTTFDGNTRRGSGRAAMSALYPGDDSPSHRGLLASGARDGSVVAYRGTSMSTAVATRDISQALLAAKLSPDGGDLDDLKRDLDASWFPGRHDPVYDTDHPHKSGRGKVTPSDPHRGRIPRNGSGEVKADNGAGF